MESQYTSDIFKSLGNVVFSTRNHAYLIDYGGSYRVGEEPIESTDIYNSPEVLGLNFL